MHITGVLTRATGPGMSHFHHIDYPNTKGTSYPRHETEDFGDRVDQPKL